MCHSTGWPVFGSIGTSASGTHAPNPLSKLSVCANAAAGALETRKKTTHTIDARIKVLGRDIGNSPGAPASAIVFLILLHLGVEGLPERVRARFRLLRCLAVRG